MTLFKVCRVNNDWVACIYVCNSGQMYIIVCDSWITYIDLPFI